MQCFGLVGAEPPGAICPNASGPHRRPGWNSAYRRFRRWAKAGIWQQVFERLQEPDFDWLMIDSTIVRAHQHASGQKKMILPASA
nr:hypothetical protein [Spirosoma luteum]